MSDKNLVDNLKEAFFNMKKYFKTPEKITMGSFAEYQTGRLRKVLNKELTNAPFLFVTNFPFTGQKGEEEYPMIFIGDINGFWKKAINLDYKRRKEFAQGICTLKVDESGKKKLVFDVRRGKGEREANLRLINKVLLKKLKVTAEFAGKVVDNTPPTKEEKLLNTIGDGLVGQITSVFGRIQQEVARYKNSSENDIETRVRHIEIIETLINEWDITYKGHKSERKKEAKQIKKLKSFLKEAKKKYNRTNLNVEQLESFKGDLKSYLINKNEFLGNIKEYKTNNTTADKLKELYSELQVLDSNIADWRTINLKPSTEETTTIGQLNSRIIMEVKDLRKWMDKDGIDYKSIDPYQHKMAEQKEADARELTKLALQTKLPKIKEVKRASSTFKKLFTAYKEYGVIPSDDIEMRKIKLLQVTAYVNQWEEEWANKNAIKKKLGNGKKELLEVEKIKEKLVEYLNAINEFTLKRDNYMDIMNSHREFIILKQSYKASPDMDDKATYLMDNINYMIDEWQMHYINISSFGTKKKNKKLEAIRQELIDFVQIQGQNKQTDDTNAALVKLSAEKVTAIQLELSELKEQKTKELYSNVDNKTLLDKIQEERKELNEQKEKIEAKPGNSAAKLSALGGLNYQLQRLNNRQNELERPIQEVVDARALTLNTALTKDKKELIEQIAISIAIQLSENADNGEFSAELIEVKGQLKQLMNTYKKHKDSPSQKVQDMLIDIKLKIKKLKKKRAHLRDKAIKEAYPKISALAKHLAEDLAKKHNLSSEQFQEVLLKLDDHSNYLANNLSKEAQKVCNRTARGILNDPHFDLENINKDIKTKLTYDYDADEDLKAIAIASVELKKLKVTDQKSRSKKLKSWYKKSKIWESKIGDYYPSPSLDKAIGEVDNYKNQISPIKEEVNHIKALSDLEKQTKVLIANQKKLKSQAADQEKKLIKAKLEDKAAIIDKINKKKNAFIETTLKLKALSLKWEDHYDKISDPSFAKKKAERKEKIHTGAESFEKQLRDLNDKAKISKKHDLAIAIHKKYNATNFQYNTKDKKSLSEAKQENIKDIQAQIVDWESISVVLLEETEMKIQEADANQIKIIRDALLKEQYRYDNAVKIYKDPVFETIKKQIERLKLDVLFKKKKVDGNKVKVDTIKQIYGIEKLLSAWKKSNPANDANCIKQYESISEWEAKFEAIKLSPVGIRSIEQQEFLIRAQELEDRYNKYTKSIDYIDIEEDDLANLRKVLVTGVKKAKAIIAIPKVANKSLDKVDAEFSKFEKNMLLRIHDAKQKDEAQVLSLLEGCDSYDKIKKILPPEQQAKIEAAKNRAVKRAELILAAGGSPREAERMLEHIPIAFWPDEFLEEMRLWRKAEALYYEKKGEEVQQEFIDSGLKQFIMDAKEAITAPMNVYNEVLKSGKYKLDVTNPDGSTSKMEFSVLDSNYEKDVSNGTPMKGTTIATNVLSSVLDAKAALDDIQKVVKSNQGDDPEAIRKRQVMIGRVIASTTQKLCTNATKYINTSVPNVNGPKIATAVLKSVSLLTKLILKSTDGLEDPVLAKEHFQELFSIENAGEIVSTLLDVGAGVSEIVGLFNTMGNVVGAAFGVAINIKDLIKSAQKLHAAVQARDEMHSVQDRAVREDSIMLHAIRREMLTAKEDVAKASIEVTGDSLRVIGSGTATVGAIVGLGHPAAGAGINVGGKIIEKLGDVIKIGGKVVFMIRDNETKKRVKKLIKEAQTDRNARIELLENSKFFAKAFLAIGLEEGDKIAEHYCLVKGLTEDDLEHEATARSILEKLIADDPTTLDEKTIGDKIQDLGKKISGIFTQYTKLDKASLRLDDVKQLRPKVTLIIETYQTLGKVSTGTTVASLILTVLTGGIGEIAFLADEALENYIDDCAKHFKELQGYIIVQAHHQDLNIESLIERIETLNQEIESLDDTDLILEKIQEVTQREEEMNIRKLYIQETIECNKLFKSIGIK